MLPYINNKQNLSLRFSEGWICPAQPANRPAAEVSGYKKHLWDVSILDELRSGAEERKGDSLG